MEGTRESLVRSGDSLTSTFIVQRDKIPLWVAQLQRTLELIQNYFLLKRSSPHLQRAEWGWTSC